MPGVVQAMTDSTLALSALDKGALASKKFRALVITILAGAGIACAGLAAIVRIAELGHAPDWMGAGAFLAGVISAVTMAPLGYIGATSWQERAGRLAAVARGSSSSGGVPGGASER